MSLLVDLCAEGSGIKPHSGRVNGCQSRVQFSHWQCPPQMGGAPWRVVLPDPLQGCLLSGRPRIPGKGNGTPLSMSSTTLPSCRRAFRWSRKAVDDP